MKKNKKLVSAVMVSALAATTMTMPVFAAGGSVHVDVATKTAILRVAVPTALTVAVDQLEMGDTGVQIQSSTFTMENKSGVAVRVGVTSTATLGANTTLVPTKSDATSSTEAGEAWVAVAAQTSDGSYSDGTATTIGALTDANANVATFVQGTDANATKATAEQTFYLKKGTAKYVLLNANQSAKDKNYVQYYKLEAKTVADQDALDALLASEDLYYATAAATDDQELTLLAKGTAHTKGTNDVFYSVADSETDPNTITDSHTELYVYADGTADTTKGKAAFRYIGKLSDEQVAWSKTDIPEVDIVYDIVGVKDSGYTKVEGDCTYGLYKDPAPVPTAGLSYVSGKDNTDVVLKFTPPEGKTLATNYATVNGVNASTWGSFASNFVFDTTNNTVTIKAGVFAFGSVSNATTDHKYTFTVKDSDGTIHTTAEVDLTP